MIRLSEERIGDRAVHSSESFGWNGASFFLLYFGKNVLFFIDREQMHVDFWTTFYMYIGIEI